MFYNLITRLVQEFDRQVDELTQENIRLRAQPRAREITPPSEPPHMLAYRGEERVKDQSENSEEKMGPHLSKSTTAPSIKTMPRSETEKKPLSPAESDVLITSEEAPPMPPNMIVHEADDIDGGESMSIVPVPKKPNLFDSRTSVESFTGESSNGATSPKMMSEGHQLSSKSKAEETRNKPHYNRVSSLGYLPRAGRGVPFQSVAGRANGSHACFTGLHSHREHGSWVPELLSGPGDLGCGFGEEGDGHAYLDYHAEFELKPHWRESLLQSSDGKPKNMNLNKSMSAAHLEADQNIDFNTSASNMMAGSLSQAAQSSESTHHAQSSWKLLWDVAGMCLIFFDVIWMPMQVFEPPESSFTEFMMWTTLLFWSIDMMACFFRPYVKEGHTITQCSLTALHYTRTWFPIDCVVVGTDWVVVMMKITADKGEDVEEGGDYKALGKFFRVLRFLRMLRLTRVFKCKRILDEMHDRINSEYTSTIMDVIKLILMLLMANHFLACIWYFIGDNSSRRNWLSHGGFHERSFEYTYFTALHWSLTQFTPASMSVQPENVAERTFTIVVIVIALVCFSSFLSSITNSIRQLKDMREDDRRQFWLLRRFLKDAEVSQALGVRIMRYLEYATSTRKKTIQESQIKILDMLSDQLRRELRCATSTPYLIMHPLFEHINMVSNVTMHRMVSKALSRTSLACGDPLFFAGELASMMFFVKDGELQYIIGNMPQWVVEQEWASEPALWTTWTHLGDMLAMTVCEVSCLDYEGFSEATHANPAIFNQIRAYAVEFIKVLNDGKDLSDMAEYYSQARTALEEYVDLKKKHSTEESMTGQVTDASSGVMQNMKRAMSELARPIKSKVSRVRRF